LLHVQCRLVALEMELDDLEETIRSSQDMDSRRSLQRWELLMERASVGGSAEESLVKKLDEFEGLLEKYCK
jgi:hypothetical protein